MTRSSETTKITDCLLVGDRVLAEAHPCRSSTLWSKIGSECPSLKITYVLQHVYEQDHWSKLHMSVHLSPKIYIIAFPYSLLNGLHRTVLWQRLSFMYGVKREMHGVGKRARTFPPDAEDTLWRHISKTCGATLFGATLFGDAAFSCDATFWRCIVWRHIVWWRHIFLWRHILAPHCLAPHCLATPHFPVTPHFGATLFGATLFGDATFSCDATFWRRILWRHIVWWRHIGGCYVASVGLKLGWNGLGWGLVVWAKMHPVRGVFLGAW